jgi:hypothetical protein
MRQIASIVQPILGGQEEEGKVNGNE